MIEKENTQDNFIDDKENLENAKHFLIKQLKAIQRYNDGVATDEDIEFLESCYFFSTYQD